MRTVDVGPARLALDEVGARTDPVLVLLHAGNATRSMWDPLIEPLSTRHRVIRYDARGFGGSTPADGSYGGSDDVVAVLDALGIRRATLVGASFGGRVALDTALKEPDRVAALVMIGSVPSGAVPDLTVAERRLADAADESEDADDWARRAELDVDIWSVGPTRHRDEVDPMFLARAIRDAHAQVGLLRTRPSASCRPGDPPAVDRLVDLTAPLLSIVGEHDFAFTRAQHERTVEAVGGDAQGATIADAAHFPGVEQAGAVLDVLVPWLAARNL